MKPQTLEDLISHNKFLRCCAVKEWGYKAEIQKIQSLRKRHPERDFSVVIGELKKGLDIVRQEVKEIKKVLLPSSQRYAYIIHDVMGVAYNGKVCTSLGSACCTRNVERGRLIRLGELDKKSGSATKVSIREFAQTCGDRTFANSKREEKKKMINNL